MRPPAVGTPLAGFGNAAVPFLFYDLSLIPRRLGAPQVGAPIVGAVITQVTGLMFVDILGKTARIRIVRGGVPLAGAVCASPAPASSTPSVTIDGLDGG